MTAGGTRDSIVTMASGAIDTGGRAALPRRSEGGSGTADQHAGHRGRPARHPLNTITPGCAP